MAVNRFNAKIFALLLEKAKGERSWRQFAFDCDISYVQMRKLAQSGQDNPPRPKLIKKIADNSFNEIDLEDFMFAAGMVKNDENFILREGSQKQEDIMTVYRGFPQKEKNTIDAFIEFLAAKLKKQED